MGIDRRRALYMMGAGMGAVALGGASRGASAQEARELVIVTYPGALSEPHRWLANEIQARHPGLTIRLVPSDSQDIVAQIKAAQGYSPFDAGPNDEPPHLIGIKEGYLARREGNIPNLANAYPDLVARSEGVGVPATYSLVGIAYNTDMVKVPPTSWADLWRPEFNGRVGIARTSSNLGLATLAIAAKTHGGSESDLAVGWEKLQALEPKAARSPASLTQMLEREEIAICPLWNNNTAAAAAKGLPVAFVKPAPGAIAIISFFSGFAKTRHPELVAEWLNGILSTEYQSRAAAAPYYFGPTVKGVPVPADAAPYTPATPEEVLALQTIDWKKIVPVRGELVERFDRTFAF